MPKSKDTKEKLVAGLFEDFDKAKSAVLVDYKGLKVKESEELRKALRNESISFRVVKNSLLKIVLKEKKIEVDQEVLDKPLALAIGFQDEAVPAKAINDYAKNHEALEIVGGILENEFISESKVKQLAMLPSRQELQAKLLGTISAPMSGFVNVAAGNIRGLINVIRAKAEAK
ncbi:MAG: 50S ribosomal protein L10 [bacterium ADurb.Bin212]|nr:MAG: 50S ribosomal protein L10 [bacterium ADurb.Bin212]